MKSRFGTHTIPRRPKSYLWEVLDAVISEGFEELALLHCVTSHPPTR